MLQCPVRTWLVRLHYRKRQFRADPIGICFDAGHSHTAGAMGKGLACPRRVRSHLATEPRADLSGERPANPLVTPKKTSLRGDSSVRRALHGLDGWLRSPGAMISTSRLQIMTGGPIDKAA